MSENNEKFIQLEQKLGQLIQAYKDIKIKNETLKEEIEVLQASLRSSRHEQLKMKDKIDQLKVSNALLGDKEHRRLMKLRVNKLIKELDVCIAQVKNERI